MSDLAILCVDDERIVLSGLKDQLRRRFGDVALVETAESGEEGLQVFDELLEEGISVPVVISDQLMPGMKGEEFLAKVYRRDERTLNILLTGQATVEAVGEAVNTARLYRYLGKPWAETDLVLTVTEALRVWKQGRELETRSEELRLAHAASLRFVPRELLSLLGRERLVDVTYGDHAVKDVSILISDMRGFTTLLERQSPADGFRFVNEYVQLMEKPIRDNEGFIVNIEGDAILALFPGGPDHAVRAGIVSHQTLRGFNVARAGKGEEPVRMGLGINTGRLLLGTIGGEERLQCDVVGDPVNLASRVESLTKLYGTEMLVSDASIRGLKDPSAFRLREVDRVFAKGKSRAITLYEALDALDDEAAARKTGTMDAFRAAREEFTAGRLETARELFCAVVEQDPTDTAARVLAERCEHLAVVGLPADWAGVTALEQK